MTALIWRLHRNQAYVAGAALAALTCLLLLTGIVMAHDYHAFLASCATTRSCGDATQLLFRGDAAITTLVDATMAVPLLLGVFWGARCWPESSKLAPTTWPGPRASRAAAGSAATSCGH